MHRSLSVLRSALKSRVSAFRLQRTRGFSSAAVEPSTDAAFPVFSGQTKLLINNEFVDSVSGKTFPTINPGNGEVITQVAEADAADVDIAVKAANKAFYEGPWGTSMTPRERGALLYRLADLVEQNKEELAQLESLDNGKALTLSQNVDAPACAAILRYYAGWADKITGRHIPIGKDFLCYTRHEAVGVVGSIIPWNLPLIACAAKLGPALTTGNTVVMKSAEQTPLSALRLAELVVEAGFPAGVVNILSGYGHTAGQAIVEHEAVDKISFTGSVDVGKHIQATAAKTLKRVTLELGGKNPSIVFDDADIDLALENVHNGLFWNKGEACAAGTRIFVQDNIYDEFVERATEKAKAWRVGNPFASTTDQGAQVSEEQLTKVLGYIQSAREEGATLLAGGNRVGSRVRWSGIWKGECRIVF